MRGISSTSDRSTHVSSTTTTTTTLLTRPALIMLRRHPTTIVPSRSVSIAGARPSAPVHHPEFSCVITTLSLPSYDYNFDPARPDPDGASRVDCQNSVDSEMTGAPSNHSLAFLLKLWKGAPPRWASNAA